MSNIAAEQRLKRIEGGLPPSFEEIGIYRKHLARLRPNAVDEPRFMQIFNPTKEPGRSIYASFTDAELLEMVLPQCLTAKEGLAGSVSTRYTARIWKHVSAAVSILRKKPWHIAITGNWNRSGRRIGRSVSARRACCNMRNGVA